MGRKAKISIIGAGNVGAATAFVCAVKNLGDLVLVDIDEGRAKGMALDIQQAAAGLGTDINVAGGGDYGLTKGSNIVVITAGVPRKPGMSREDLVTVNTKIVAEVAQKSAAVSSQAVFVVVTNPLDSMSYVVKQTTKLPQERVIGQAGILDTLRMKSFIAERLAVGASGVDTLVLGSHGDDMVPLVSKTAVNGKPLAELLSKQEIDQIIKRTKEGGTEIVGLLKTGSAYFAPAVAIATIVEAILKDSKKVYPCSAYLKGEYGLNDVFVGVPVRLGKKGIKEIVEVGLNGSEKANFKKAAESIKSTQKIAEKILEAK